MERVKPQYYVTVDAVVFTILQKQLKILLIKRKNAPFANMFALPGGYVEQHEDLDQAVHRELQEETGVAKIFLEQVGTFGKVERDPRGRTVSVAYLALIDADKVRLEASTDAQSVQWVDVKKLPTLAFDHKEIVQKALSHLRKEIQNRPIAFQLLAEEFTLTQLQHVYEVVLDTQLDKRNFRKKVFADGLVIETQKTMMDGVHRPARLYKFKK